MRLLFAGTPAPAVPSLDALVASAHEVVAVLTRPDAPAGRRRALTASVVADRAAEHGLPVIKASGLRDIATQQQLRDLGLDAAAIVAYGALVPRDVLAIPRLGWVNLHFSLLPAWRGAAPVHHALLAGDDVTGATTFRLDEGLDTGPVLGVMTEAVRSRDTTGDLLGRLATGGAALLVATMDGLAGGDLEAHPQPADGVSHAPKVEVADGRVRWDVPAVQVDRQVRACTPAPGAWTTWGERRVGLGPVTVADDANAPPAGVVAVRRDVVLVGCGDRRSVSLGDVRPAGKAAMPAAAWARGARGVDGASLT